jgi:hypothetical protein
MEDLVMAFMVLVLALTCFVGIPIVVGFVIGGSATSAIATSVASFAVGTIYNFVASK